MRQKEGDRPEPIAFWNSIAAVTATLFGKAVWVERLLAEALVT